jgi:NADPH:quinone reductase-like Zn-dependent oxidoreductase
MRSVEIPRFGLEHIAVVDRPEPEPAPGEVVVKVHAASLNYRDFLIALGFYKPDLALPLVPLSDGAGEVTAVGPGVSGVAVGDRVSSCFWQTWADGPATLPRIARSTGCEAPGMATEFAVLPAEAVVSLPDGLAFDAAATLPCAALTAWTALTTVGRTRPGHTVLALGTGGVSLFALQFAKAMGARVIITSSSDEKLERAKALGADHVINYKRDAAWGKTAFGLAGSGVNTVVEIGGAGTLAQSIDALGCDGNIAYLGQLAGMSGELNLIGLVAKCAGLHGVLVGSRAAHEEMLAFVAEHGIQPVIDHRVPLADTGAALAAMPAGQHFGKVVVSVA